MSMPKPTDEHVKLAKLVGKWEGEETLHPSPFDPQGGKATGRVNNRRALDGFVVVQDYEQERGGAVTFRGHGVFSYDPARNSYRMTWWDSYGAPASNHDGTFEGDRLVLEANGPQGKSRATFDLSKPGHYAFKMEVSPDGQQWMTFMEGDYTRAD